MKIIEILSLICFLTIGILAQANTTVSGTLPGGRAIANQKIKLVSQTETFETTTDTSGNYKFANVADGNYLLVYNDKQASVTVKNGQVSIANLAEVVVISAGTTQSIDEVSKSVNIIDSQELRDRADFSLTETLRSIPGFRVQQLGGFGRTASIKTRGLRNQDTAILIDGIRFRDASAITGDASGFLSDFTLTSVNKIEVLRGSGSSLYGTNAIGGTIDFQTPKPTAGMHGQIGGAFGGYGLKRFRGNFSDGTEDGKFGFNLGVSRTLYTKGIDGEDDAHNTNFQSRIEYNPFEKTNISARFFVSDAFVRLNSNPDTIGTLPASNATIINAVPLARDLLKRYENGQSVSNFGSATFIPDANDPDNFQKSQAFAGQLALTQIVNDKLVFQTSYQGLRTARKNDNGILGLGFQSPSTSLFKGFIQTANAHFNWTPNRYTEATFGYEFEREKYRNDGLTPTGAGNFITRAYQTSHTIYAQGLLKFFDNKLQLAGGFRTQVFDLKKPEFSGTNPPYSNLALDNPPNAYTFDGAASYFFATSGTKIRAHVGNGYRVPSLYERFGTFYSGFSRSFFAFGNPDLKPERTIAFDGGVDQNFFGNHAKISAVYFYTKLIDTIGFANGVSPIGTTARPFGGYLNTKGGIARGLEFSGQLKATKSTDIFASYTFTNSDQRAPQVAGSGIIETLAIPKNQFTLVATQRFRRAWVNFDFLAADSYIAPISSNTTFQTYIYRFKGNRRGDLTGGYTFPINNEKLNLRVYGTIENLFDDDYYENGFRTFGRNGRIGLSFGF
ncbi:MAG: TonB-dependent receptor plug domain-containing protein [Pyrinomonadaceae bacterium]